MAPSTFAVWRAPLLACGTVRHLAALHRRGSLSATCWSAASLRVRTVLLRGGLATRLSSLHFTAVCRPVLTAVVLVHLSPSSVMSRLLQRCAGDRACVWCRARRNPSLRTHLRCACPLRPGWRGLRDRRGPMRP